MKLTQYDRVLQHLQNNKKLSQKQAINLYGAYRLSDIIYRMRKAGYKISTNFKSGKNRFGDSVSWAEYRLEA
ncbi:MAG: DNA-binding protein [Clostridia bacterium]|nr:DNA-binding protein [Clostridia bacterium]